MKRKLLALVFVLAFAITSFAALGVTGVSAAPGGDNAACPGLVGTALPAALAGTAGTPAPTGDVIGTVTDAYPGDCF
jgi:hypothetical protein